MSVSDSFLGWLTAALAAAGAFNIVLGLEDGIAAVVRRAVMLRRRSWIALRRPAGAEAPFDPFGLDAIPWGTLRVLAALAGMGLALMLFWERNPYLAAAGLLGNYGPAAVRAMLLRRRREAVQTRIRTMIQSLHGALLASGGLGPALWALADFLPEGDAVGERLRLHLGTGRSGPEVLAALAADFRSDTLAGLAQTLADAGIRPPEEILGDVLEQMRTEETRRLQETVGAAPVRLLVPMLLLLLPPILVLALYPPVARLLAVLAGGPFTTIPWR